MNLFQAAVLGVVQGVTEFLPVSSSGHLIIFPELLKWNTSSMTFDVAVHVASLLAILIALRGDLKELINGLVLNKPEDRRLVFKITLATLPAVFIGGVFGDFFEQFRVLPAVAWALIIWGIILFAADKVALFFKRETEKIREVSWLQSFIIGCVQVLAFFPGTSRSGSTISAGLFLGLSKEAAAKFSFFLAIPAIIGAGAMTFIDVVKHGLDVSLAALVVGSLAALVSGILAIKFLLLIIRRWSFAPFALYRVVFGLILLIIAYGS